MPVDMQQTIHMLKHMKVEPESKIDRQRKNKKHLMKKIYIEVKKTTKEMITKRGASVNFQRQLAKKLTKTIMKSGEWKFDPKKIRDFTQQYIKYTILKEMAKQQRNHRREVLI